MRSTPVTSHRTSRRRGRALTAVVAALSVLVGPLFLPSAAAAESEESQLRSGVLAVAGAVSAVGQLPELAEPLPFTSTSLSQVLQLDEKLAKDLTEALTGTDLEEALGKLEGVEIDEDASDENTVTFDYSRVVENHRLQLVYDDGDLRFLGAEAGRLDVTLATTEPFVVEVDQGNQDALTNVSLVGRPELDLTVEIRNPDLPSFAARQGFTELDVTGGHYRIRRERHITMRDPDGRGVLTLEDLRYSTLPDMFNIEPAEGTTDELDVLFDVALPEDFHAGDEATGTLSVTGADTPEDRAWPTATEATRDYGTALAAATELTMADGLTALAKYTGAVLALQQSADVPLPNLAGSTSDVFAPGDELLSLLSTAAAAQIRCGAAPGNPPVGAAAPGDAVYCSAVTAESVGTITSADWSTNDDGRVGDESDAVASVGPDPTGTVRIDGSDGEPDVSVTFTVDPPGPAKTHQLTARSMPLTVQDVVRRIDTISGPSTAAASLDVSDPDAPRLDVAVDLKQPTTTVRLPLGNSEQLGALVGLTGVRAPQGADGSTAEVRGTDASFDVGFGVSAGPAEQAEAEGRETVLLPADDTLIELGGLAVGAAPSSDPLVARIGFLGVDAAVTDLRLGQQGDGAAVSLSRAGEGTGPLPLQTLLTSEGALRPDEVLLSSNVTAGISFDAEEQPLPGGAGYATGQDGPASGSADIDWLPGALPAVAYDDGYEQLRVFDPVPAAFLAGTARVTTAGPGPDGEQGTVDDPSDSVSVDLPDGTNLYDELGVAPPEENEPATEVARRLVAEGLGCQNVTLVDADTLTCEGLAPNGEAGFADGEPVELIVLGDPFALRDGIIEGLAATLAAFDRLAGDNRDEGLADDQYVSSLPLVDLTPAQLAVERDGLRQGLANLTAAATEDAGGAGDEQPPVSSAQELSTAVSKLVTLQGRGSFRPSLSYTLGGGALGVALSALSPDGTTLEAPLRFIVNGPGQVGSADSFRVGVHSETTLAIDVAVDTAHPIVADATGTTSSARMDLGAAELSGTKVQAGVGEFTLGGPSAATLDVTVQTDFVPGSMKLETTRSTSGVADPDHATNKAAVVDLAVADDQSLHFHAAATDSSGGAGAAQPAPEAMQVKFAAEGLDGLATALEGALDGAAAQNLSDQGAPVSAPLIGTDLDAGAEIADTLRSLTSALRTELADVTAQTAGELPAQLETAAVDAVNGTAGLADIASATAEVTCVGDECETCTTPEDGGEPVCSSVGPTGWQKVTISTTLSGTEKEGKVAFDTGLPGLEVRSDKTVSTTTSWTLPITLELERGVGPQVRINDGDALELDVAAALPAEGIKAIVGYLPAQVTGEDAAARTVDTTVTVTPGEPGGSTYDLFALYDGKLTAEATFADIGDPEEGLSLDFETLTDGGSPLHLLGTIDVPWTAAGGFGTVSYNKVRMDVGAVVATMAKPFEVVDPYLAPLRDVIDVLRTPIPVVSDLSELGGGGELSLLTLLETLSTQTQDPNLTLVYNVLGLVDGVAQLMHGIAGLAQEEVPLEDLSTMGTALTIAPTELLVYEKCTQTVRGTATTNTRTGKPTCPTVDVLAKKQQSRGVRSQTTRSQRRGVRAAVEPNVGRKTKEVTASIPGFSLPFLADPNQILDVVTGEGEASYFRLDLGTLAASFSYTQTFGPIMAGPVPISPFVGGSVGIEGRLAMGFDSLPQTLAVESLPHLGDVDTLMATYRDDDFDVIDEGFYLDDLDAEGADVPEVKLVVTLEAGAGVSIGIVSAGLKGGITLTIGLDLNDPNDDGRLRTAEIRDTFNDRPGCVFDVKAELEAFIAIFVRIWVLHAPIEYSFDLLRLGPYTLFEYGCEDENPKLVKWEDGDLALTSGRRSTDRLSSASDVSDDYEVRQFDSGGGAAKGGLTRYEVSAFGRVQNVHVEASEGAKKYKVTLFPSAITLSADLDAVEEHETDVLPRFNADGGADDDILAFLQGETFDEDRELVTTSFSTPVTALTGGPGNDALTTGDADDKGVDGGDGDDTISLALGDDVASGGAGNDTLSGGAGRDDLTGHTGNDRLEGGPGADRASGGEGADALVGGPGRDVRAVLVLPKDRDTDADGDGVADIVEEQVRLGFDSGDVLIGGSGTDTVDGGDGSDVVIGGHDDELTAAEVAGLFTTGDRTVNVLTEGDTNPQPQEVQGITTAAVPDPDEFDRLCRSGATLPGGNGGDFVTGGAEGDLVVGGNGPDRLDGGGGPDEICGRAGNDRASGDGGAADEGSNADVMRGGTGDDLLVGDVGRDVLFGDDVDLFRGGERVLDGSLGLSARGAGDDHLDGGDANDILSGGAGSDLLLGGAGDDVTSGEGRDTAATGGAAPDVKDRLLACNVTTRIVAGKVDLNGDLLAGAATEDGVVADDGRLGGFEVTNGVVQALDGSGTYSGLIGEDTVVVDGLIDLDRDGDVPADSGDTGIVPLASMLSTADSNPDGDCVLAEEGDDQLRGGAGSDFVGAGEGTDLALGGDGNDLVLGEEGTDVLLGGPHHDVLVGGEGDDHLQGEGGDDRLRGNEGADDLIGGSDESASADGQDVMIGGRGEDVLAAENARLVSAGIVSTLTSSTDPDSWTTEPEVPGAVLADATSELRFADSAVVCADGDPSRWLTLLAQDGEDGDPDKSPGVPLAYDELYGGHGCDWVFGSTGDDVVRGGQDDDVVEGGAGEDIGYGDAGDDVVVGGSSVDPTKDQPVTVDRSGDGVLDAADTIDGDGGPDGHIGEDLLLGDNATVNRVTAVGGTTSEGETPFDRRYAVRLHATEHAAESAAGDGSDLGDTMRGGGDPDRIFGQEGPDIIDAGTGDDYVEGNQGADTISTGDGYDDVIGGSSTDDGLPLGLDGRRLQVALEAEPFDASAAGVPDAGDTVRAGSGADVVLGDNGRITRPADTPDGARDIAIADPHSDPGGDDVLLGEEGSDRLLGQDGTDTIDAGAGEDHVEGGPGVDTAYGQDGDDVLIGGSSMTPDGAATLDDLPEFAVSDTKDILYGDSDGAVEQGDDLIFGDNATVLDGNAGPRSSWVVVLNDSTDPAVDTFGADRIISGPETAAADADEVWGQGGDDVITTGADDDYVEGNQGDDAITGGVGDDDVMGGSSANDGMPRGEDGGRLVERLRTEPGENLVDDTAAGIADGDDSIDGGVGHDVLLGDNGRLTRPGGVVSSSTSTQPVRHVAMADTETGGSSGSDDLVGGAGDDVLYGQLDNGASGELGAGDTLSGGDGTDFVQGDLAVVTPTAAEDIGDEETLSLSSGTLTEQVYVSGSLVPVTHVPDGTALVGGSDVALGGAGDDVLRLGSNSDLGNGDDGRDVLFGGFGPDALWGGPGEDRLFGGYGEDDLDLKPRDGDPDLYSQVRSAVDSDGKKQTTNGADTMYGGWGPDELQADEGGTRKDVASDHLIDWVGAHNVYYVCGGSYGPPRVIRQSSPDMEELLVDLAAAAGGTHLETLGSGGWFDLGLVYNGDHADNSKKSPEFPGNHTCEGGGRGGGGGGARR